jgi:hypothetical protein
VLREANESFGIRVNDSCLKARRVAETAIVLPGKWIS